MFENEILVATHVEYIDPETWFDPFYTEFTEGGAILFASLPEQEATYSIDILTLQNAHVKTISGHTYNGQIKENWDLVYDDGTNVFSGTSFKATYSLTLIQSGRIGTHNAAIEQSAVFLYDGKFTVAYAWDNTSIAQGSMRNCLQWGVVDQLVKPTWAGGSYDNPYTSDFNEYSWPGGPGDPGYIANNLRATALKTSLGHESVRNFYFNGHGSPTKLGDGENGNVTIDIDSVSGVLGNNYNHYSNRWRKHPYRLVFLDACETANNPNWAHAFGVYDSITPDQLSDRPDCVQAFVGWIGEPRGPSNSPEWLDMAETYTVFFGAWMQGFNLEECIRLASSKHPSAPFDLFNLTFPLGNRFPWYTANWDTIRGGAANNFWLKVYGYRWITRENFDPAP